MLGHDSAFECDIVGDDPVFDGRRQRESSAKLGMPCPHAVQPVEPVVHGLGTTHC